MARIRRATTSGFLANMIQADEVAQGDVKVFTSLFLEAWVTDVVKADPSIVRHSYWNCVQYP